MTDVLIRDVPVPLLEALKRRARRRHRSLQQELLAVLEASAEQLTDRAPQEVAEAIRTRLAQSGRTFSDSSVLLREDRAR